MSNLSFTVVIPTHNRAHLVWRAIQSVIDQNWPDTEIIVVDDASTDSTPDVLPAQWPQVRYVRQMSNQGPGAARNRGIALATGTWVVMLDDDDTLAPDALARMNQYMTALSHLERFPVVQFAHTYGKLAGPYQRVTLADYLQGRISGDFVPVIQVARFKEMGLAYPTTRIGAEHLLWWRIAQEVGIPSWTQKVAVLHTDAPARLTSVNQQIRHARLHAEAQEATLAAFGAAMREWAPALYDTKRLGAAAYWLLAGERAKARRFLTREGLGRPPAAAAVLRLLALLPLPLTRAFFHIYRGRAV